MNEDPTFGSAVPGHQQIQPTSSGVPSKNMDGTKSDLDTQVQTHSEETQGARPFEQQPIPTIDDNKADLNVTQMAQVQLQPESEKKNVFLPQTTSKTETIFKVGSNHTGTYATNDNKSPSRRFRSISKWGNHVHFVVLEDTVPLRAEMELNSKKVKYSNVEPLQLPKNIVISMHLLFFSYCLFLCSIFQVGTLVKR